MTTALSDAAAEVLRTAVADETSVKLTAGQLDRKVYLEVNKALERIGGGGKWNRRAQVHLFTRDPRPELEQLLGAGQMPRDARKEDQFFRTPADVADDMAARLSGIFGGLASFDVLEPSAGDGALVRAVNRRHPRAYIEAVEPDQHRSQHLTAAGASSVYPCTFEEFHGHIACQNGGSPQPQFDAVVMNPPFRIGGDSLAWVDHVTMAWDLIRPGGRLLAIVPASLTFRDDKRVTALRERIAATDDGGWEELPDGTFNGEGTGVRTVLLDVPL